MRSHRAINRSVRRVGTTALALAVVAVGLAGIGLRADRAGATPSEYFPAITVAGGNGQGSAANQVDTPGGVAVAGGKGQGSAANQLSGPFGVAVDGDGNVYVADTFNSRVQRWAPGASAGVTVAGGNGYGSAANQLDGPGGPVGPVVPCAFQDWT
jgi:hypothetical protein